MFKRLSLLTLALGAALLLLEPAAAQEAVPRVLVATANGPVAPAMAEYLDRSLEQAARQNAEVLIFRLDTPGGGLETMNRMVQALRASRVPVVVYVSPRGAIAGSAGTLLTLAGHVSAMAPETIIGAASPVGSQGENIESTLESKLKEATKATVRSLMEGRPPEAIHLAEETIDAARAVTASEALEVGLVDLIATDVPDLLHQLDGREVRTAFGLHTLHTAQAVVVEIPPTFIEQILAVLTNPNIVFILLTLGVQAILIEIGSPGGWVAGFFGVVALTFAAYGLGVLGVNWLGLIFLATAFVLFILDLKAPTHGALTAAGVGAFIVGALVLFNSPGTPEFQQVSVPLVVGSGVFIGAVFALFLTFALRAQKTPVRTGQEALVGRVGTVQVPLDPIGIVQLGGEQWTAELAEGSGPLPRGTRVQVVSIQGVRLQVRKAG